MTDRRRSRTPDVPMQAVSGQAHWLGETFERARDFCLNLYHLAPIGYVTHDADGRIVEANYTARCLLGVSADRLDGTMLASFVAREHEPLLAAHLAHVAASGVRASVELRIQRPAGTLFYATLESVRFGDEAPQFLTSIVDVSERVRLRAALGERDATLRTILATVPDALIGVDEQGSICAFGAAAERLFGVRARDVIGRHVGMLFDATAPALAEGIGSAPQPGVVRARGRRRDGSVFDAEITAGKLSGASYAVLVVRDLSSHCERVRAHEHACPAESVSRLATGIVHDTNNLLLHVVAASDALAEAADDPATVRRRAAELRRMALGGAALARHLQSVINPGGAPRREIEIDAALADMGSLLAALLGERIELRLALDAEGARVPCDRGELEQLVLNLVVNARDAMPEEGLVEIATHRIALAGAAHVRLVVRDTGVGMDESVRSRALTRGFTTKQGGTGLGLDTVRVIVERARGAIHIESEVGVGTRFTIDLPEVRLEEVRPKPVLRAAPSTLLLVERDPFARSTIRAWLEGAGYRVIEAADIEGALERCRTRGTAVRAMLTGVVPDASANGAELVERVRELCPGMPVLLMPPGPHAEGTRTEMLAHGVLMLRKPFSERELVEALHRIVGAAKPSSLLLVEDDALNRSMLGTLLERRGYAVQLAATIGEAITRYRNLSRPPDVVLTDARLPDGGVLDLVRELRSPPSDIPVLVVSGLDEHVDPEIASVLRMPRTSFVQKPAGVDELVRSIEALRARD